MYVHACEFIMCCASTPHVWTYSICVHMHMYMCTLHTVCVYMYVHTVCVYMHIYTRTVCIYMYMYTNKHTHMLLQVTGSHHNLCLLHPLHITRQPVLPSEFIGSTRCTNTQRHDELMCQHQHTTPNNIYTILRSKAETNTRVMNKRVWGIPWKVIDLLVGEQEFDAVGLGVIAHPQQVEMRVGRGNLILITANIMEKRYVNEIISAS